MIKGGGILKAAQGMGMESSVKLWFLLRNDFHSFQPVGASSFHMESTMGFLCHDGENAELVTAGVHTDPVPKMLCNGHMCFDVFSEGV